MNAYPTAQRPGCSRQRRHASSLILLPEISMPSQLPLRSIHQHQLQWPRPIPEPKNKQQNAHQATRPRSTDLYHGIEAPRPGSRVALDDLVHWYKSRAKAKDRERKREREIKEKPRETLRRHSGPEVRSDVASLRSNMPRLREAAAMKAGQEAHRRQCARCLTASKCRTKKTDTIPTRAIWVWGPKMGSPLNPGFHCLITPSQTSTQVYR